MENSMNIYDIAKEAGVSISTVSRVLNNGKTSEKTRKRVQLILDKYNYKPNAIARGLVAKTMKTIGVLIVDIRVNHFANTAYIIEQEFRKRGYNVLLCNTGGSMDNNIKYINMLSERQVDGLVLVGSIFNEIQNEPSIIRILENIPVVMANGHLNLPNSYSVIVDDYFGIKLAVDHLFGKGHQKILYVQDMETFSAKEKKKGFIGAMKEHGLYSGENNIIFKCKHGLEGGKEVVRKIVESKIEFSAIVFGEDLTAIGAMKELKEIGYEIPKDVAITGYNNLDYALITDTELTSVDNKYDLLADLSVQLLSGLIEKKESMAFLTIKPSLVVRKSS